MTLGEIGQFLRAVETQDRLDWMRTSHQMAQVFNLHRGKDRQPLSWQDFNPYAAQARREVPPAKITPKVANLFQRMQNTMNDGPK